VLKYPDVCLEINFLTHLLGEQFNPIPYTFLSRQSYLRHPSQQAFEQRKEMTFDCRLPNITELVFRGLYCPSSENLMKKAVVKGEGQGLELYGFQWEQPEQQEQPVQLGFPQPPTPTYIFCAFHIFPVFHIFLRYGNIFHIFALW